ncbi:hypothetical protein Hamer_G025270 [Homarus americanus]|uniref:Uncharacterized protein n=1 Tax=Homarus americanus TaxID=6706 RepID=A0A8J5MPX8_HOMAM|nr:hypothetical protein Hamer_G025270 [Homarus americanus]
MKGDRGVVTISGAAVSDDPAGAPHPTPPSASSVAPPRPTPRAFAPAGGGFLRRLSRYASRVVPLSATAIREVPDYGATVDALNDLQGGTADTGSGADGTDVAVQVSQEAGAGGSRVNIPVLHITRSASYERAISSNRMLTSTKPRAPPVPTSTAKTTRSRKLTSRKKSNVSDTSRSSTTSNESNSAVTSSVTSSLTTTTSTVTAGGTGSLEVRVAPTAAPRYSIRNSLAVEEGRSSSTGQHLLHSLTSELE